MKLYEIRPLTWHKEQHQTWTTQGVNCQYVIRPEYHKWRLGVFFSEQLNDIRPILHDGTIDDVFEFAEKHHEGQLRVFLKAIDDSNI